MEELFDIPVKITNELERAILHSFSLFDFHGNKSVRVEDVGAILRFLGCVPSEKEILAIIDATKFDEPKYEGIIHLSMFLPHVSRLLMEQRMKPCPPEKLLEAFKVLDPEGKGYISKEDMSKALLTDTGESFTEEDLGILLKTAVDRATGLIPYEYFINQLTDEPVIYALAREVAEKIEREKPKREKSIFQLPMNL